MAPELYKGCLFVTTNTIFLALLAFMQLIKQFLSFMKSICAATWPIDSISIWWPNYGLVNYSTIGISFKILK